MATIEFFAILSTLLALSHGFTPNTHFSLDLKGNPSNMLSLVTNAYEDSTCQVVNGAASKSMYAWCSESNSSECVACTPNGLDACSKCARDVETHQLKCDCSPLEKSSSAALLKSLSSPFGGIKTHFEQLYQPGAKFKNIASGPNGPELTGEFDGSTFTDHRNGKKTQVYPNNGQNGNPGSMHQAPTAPTYISGGAGGSGSLGGAGGVGGSPGQRSQNGSPSMAHLSQAPENIPTTSAAETARAAAGSSGGGYQTQGAMPAPPPAVPRTGCARGKRPTAQYP